MPAGDILKDKIAHGLEQPFHDPPSLIWLLVLLILLKLAASWLWSPSNSMVRVEKWIINEAYANSPPIDTLTLIIIPNMNMLCPSIFTRVELRHLFYYFFHQLLSPISPSINYARVCWKYNAYIILWTIKRQNWNFSNSTKVRSIRCWIIRFPIPHRER